MESRNRILAIQLATAFSEKNKIPAKYRGGKSRKTDDKDPRIEIDFEKFISSWLITVESLFENLDIETAFRFISVTPTITGDETKFTECEEFIFFFDYLVKRRDIDNCTDDELGCLSMLLSALQQEIEEQIGVSVKPKTELKDKEAQALREKGTITIDGVDLNLWQQHSFDSVSTQSGWNKIKSFTEINSLTTGESGSIVFSGVMQVPRQEAIDYAVKLGFQVHQNISMQTDFLVAGSENISVNKAAQINRYRAKGAKIRVISEIEFLEMVAEFI